MQKHSQRLMLQLTHQTNGTGISLYTPDLGDQSHTHNMLHVPTSWIPRPSSLQPPASLSPLTGKMVPSVMSLAWLLHLWEREGVESL